MKRIVRYIAALLVLMSSAAIVQAANAAESGAKRSTQEYTIPDVNLVRADGTSVSLPDELNDGRPVVMNFIFTTCTSICPLLSETLAHLQEKLGAERNRVHIVSISIDPEEDTPARLTAYAQRYHAGPEWQHYTGTVKTIEATQRAFNAYRGDKMGHTPLTLVRIAPGQPWVRFDGFATADDLLHEIPGSALASK